MRREKKCASLKRNVFLTLALLCMVIFSSLQASAKTRTEVGWWKEFGSVVGAIQNRTIQIEQGQEFYLGYYFGDFTIDTETYMAKSKLGTELSLIYRSSMPTVASVGTRNGLVKARKVGAADIYFTYKGKKYTCTVQVKKKNSLGMGTTYKNLNKTSKVLVKKYAGKKAKAGNIADMITKANAYLNAMKKIPASKQPIYGLVGGGERPEKLVAPNDWRCQDIITAVTDYVSAHVPELPISKVTGKAGTTQIKVQLKKAPTSWDIYAMQWDPYTMEQKKISASKATFKTYVDGLSEGIGICTITKGSKEATIELRDDNGKAVKLKAGKTYGVALAGDEKKFQVK